jgi:putative oxygen-independent coproporphyrinogen III oxidase
MQTVQFSRSSPAPDLPVLPPLSLYVHVPWCVRKCPYCDFNSHELKRPMAQGRSFARLDTALENRYIQALIADLDQALALVWGRPVYTVFFGGGTPSLLSARALDELLCAIRARLPLSPVAEITLEANPGTFEAVKFAEFRALGINRLSIGIQSFNAQHLVALGRIHDAEQARAAIEIAQMSFENFNLDLMYALPEQTLAQALADVETALEFAPAHLSAYHLTLEPNTAFYRQPPALPDDDVAADMQQAIEARLAAAGYRHYETAAFAKGGCEARHNLNYWTFGDYLGVGAGAHGKLTTSTAIFRTQQLREPRRYLASVPGGVTRTEVVSEQLPFEFMLNALRLVEGFDIALFPERTGLAWEVVAAAVDRLAARGLLLRQEARLKPSPVGLQFLNDVLLSFVTDQRRQSAKMTGAFGLSTTS